MPGLDPVDTLLLDTAAGAIAAADPGEVVVIGDPSTALALELAATTAGPIRVHQDSLIHERALAAAAVDGIDAHPLAPELVVGASVVLVRLPRSLDALRAIVELVADHAAPDATVVAAGRIKHMALAMNDVLRMRFERVDVTHARQKSRALVARGPKAGAPFEPTASRVHELPGIGAAGVGTVTICAAGGAFAGTGVDIGTRFLIEQLASATLDTSAAIDFACGTGIVGAWLALHDPSARAISTDVSAIAVASARATMLANDVLDRVSVIQDIGLASQPDASATLVILNPPFHEGAAINKDLAPELFADAARVLAPGSQLWTVWNSHLRYRGALERIVGPSEQVARNSKFTVTRSLRA